MDITTELMKIGFKEYEAKVYAALVADTMMSAHNITKVTGVPRGRVYDVLGTLMNEGLCKMIPGTVKKYQVIDPQRSFDSILQAHRKEQDLREQRIMELSTKLQSIHNGVKPDRNELDCVTIYTSMSSIAQKSFDTLEQAETIHRSLCKPPYFTINKMDELAAVSAPVLKAIQKGIEFRSIYEIEEDNLENFITICRFFHENGEHVRVMKQIPLKLVIMDSTAVMFTLFHKSQTKNNVTSMYVEHSDVIYGLIDLFEHYWDIAIPFDRFVADIKETNAQNAT